MKSFQVFPTGITYKLFGFSLIMMVAYFGDTIMSYTSPLYMEEHLGNQLMMGFVMAFSSIIGIIADFAIGGWLREQKSRFFTLWCFLLAVTFPLIFLIFPPALPYFLLAMAVWGVYYELAAFSSYHFIDEHTKAEHHTFAWGLLSTFKSVAYTFAPLVASLAAEKSIRLSFEIALGLYIFSLGLVVAYMFYFKRKYQQNEQRVQLPRGVINELRIWSVLTNKVWHLFTFMFMLALADATFWTVGVLFAEEFPPEQQGMFLVMYGLPSLALSIFAGVAAKPFGKKRAAFISAIFGGIFLAIAGLTADYTLVLALTFVASCFLAISWPEVYAVFEDYVKRLGKTGNEFIGLQSAIVSLSYIIGPILAGAIASFVGNQTTFAVVGGLLALVSLAALIIVPRKIRMPQTQLKQLEYGQN